MTGTLERNMTTSFRPHRRESVHKLLDNASKSFSCQDGSAALLISFTQPNYNSNPAQWNVPQPHGSAHAPEARPALGMRGPC